MAGGKRARRSARTGVQPDDAIIGALGGIGLTYGVLVAHGFPHPVHWLTAGAGGLIGGMGVWTYAERARLVRAVRRLRVGRTGRRQRPGNRRQ